MSSSELYEADILEWSELQAERLRVIAADDRLNPDSPDWPNIIEEIESVGRSELSSVQSLLLQALVHMLELCGNMGDAVIRRRSVLAYW